ncbi:MAG: aminotransferase class V-fold PLP-dependent enzyme [Candidatus Latescibacteria bacterium]|nr:aminotransferase class V-fold PLP-dependent enzyme [Candidatus Latescibacterota bacterium]NIO27132.1 aminotransferase class V-fold PLP-dependent enzyme [Candidatus Latescibacterota bacterium]NIO54656.1 aminotransferase class V-fold PLP-dependent enzyme [Candidatus Latescibacterota bacterium]NIT00739.1 aminotransferase class V-fold PLP-dependent enzyme [Candidatus Latescibacterota bacterium]NIT37662.1 aminotransferase class V-fold PLP-dependent enzyme [Candidatus Latescibacterota bacterium]
MTKEIKMPTEETLDPEDWESVRALGRRMLDDMMDYMRTLRERPAWRHAPDKVKAHFSKPLPYDPQPQEEIYDEFLEYVLPYPVGNLHPSFWGWVMGTGTVFGALAELLAASMNTNTGGGAYHSANYVEKQVIDWTKEMLGYPASASGLLTSGCSAANLIGLGVARNTKAGYDLRSEGIQVAPQKMVLYASNEIHTSVHKAVELLGLGRDALRLVPVNDIYQIDLNALQTAIAKDRQDGHLPFCVVGAAGTTNTGAIDDLSALADICQEEGLWLHVDGAFGAWAALVPDARHLVDGMERADSLALDLHKWMYMPCEIGCILVRSEDDHRKAFSLTPAYLSHGEVGRGLAGSDLPWFSDYGFQLSRGFRALKAWMSIKEHGASKYGRLIQQNIDQARYLGELIDAAPELELAAPVTLNVVCFRYTRAGLDDTALDELNKQIEVELQERGIAVPSVTTIRGRCVLHVAITNHRSRREDFDVLVREAIRIGKEMDQSRDSATE